MCGLLSLCMGVFVCVCDIVCVCDTSLKNTLITELKTIYFSQSLICEGFLFLIHI